MLCINRVKESQGRAKGSGKPVTRYQWFGPNYVGPIDTSALPICGGEIKATIRAVDEPDWGGCHAVLEVEFVCLKCGSIMPNPALPNGGFELSVWVTERIKELR